jgi:hypothetical protein
MCYEEDVHWAVRTMRECQVETDNVGNIKLQECLEYTHKTELEEAFPSTTIALVEQKHLYNRTKLFMLFALILPIKD